MLYWLECTFLKTLTLDCDSAGATAPLPGELFTQQYKSAAFSIACTINWLGLFVLGMVFPIMEVRKLARFVYETASLRL